MAGVKVFFDIEIDEKPSGRIVMELFSDVVCQLTFGLAAPVSA